MEKKVNSHGFFFLNAVNKLQYIMGVVEFISSDRINSSSLEFRSFIARIAKAKHREKSIFYSYILELFLSKKLKKNNFFSHIEFIFIPFEVICCQHISSEMFV